MMGVPNPNFLRLESYSSAAMFVFHMGGEHKPEEWGRGMGINGWMNEWINQWKWRVLTHEEHTLYGYLKP